MDEIFEAIYEEQRRRSDRLTLRDWLDLAEAYRIAAALREHDGNRSAAARALGIGRRTLYAKMERLAIRPTWHAPTATGAARHEAEPGGTPRVECP